MLLFLAALMFRGLNGQEADYTRGELKKALEAGQVLEAVSRIRKLLPVLCVWHCPPGKKKSFM